MSSGIASRTGRSSSLVSAYAVVLGARVDRERDADDVAGLVHQRRAGVAGRELGGEHEHRRAGSGVVR